jgi:hypothetical protein
MEMTFQYRGAIIEDFGREEVDLRGRPANTES